MEPIDLVIPYVDAADPTWQLLYNEYNPSTTKTEEINSISRFRGQGDFFKYFFRCIDRNLNWIRNLFFVIQSPSQVPAWLDQTKVKIIYHKDIIPEEYLPTFNSTCIEMFLWRIPGLSERFLYANDDIYALQYFPPSLFFTDDGKVRNNTALGSINSMWGNHCLNAYRIAYNRSEEDIKGMAVVPIMKHSIRPYLRSEMEKCFHEHEEEISNSISRFRDKKNINIYIFDHYLINHGKQFYREYIKNRTLSSQSSIEKIKMVLGLPPELSNMLCIEDNLENINIYEDKYIKLYFSSRYYNKCKYEIEC